MTNCDIIRDLLPLYHDNACSSTSRILVEEHVSACSLCSAMLREMDEPFAGVSAQPQTLWGGSPVNSFLPPASRLKQAKNRLVRKTAMAVSAVFCAMGLIACAGAVLYGEFEKERIIPWSQALLKEVSAGTTRGVQLEFSPKRYVRAVCLFRRVDIDGQEKDIAILQLTQSLTRKTFDSFVGGPQQVAMGLSTGLTLGRGGQKHDVAYGAEYKPEYWNPFWEYPGTLAAVYYLETPPLPDLYDASEQSVLHALEQNGQCLWPGSAQAASP